MTRHDESMGSHDESIGSHDESRRLKAADLSALSMKL